MKKSSLSLLCAVVLILAHLLPVYAGSETLRYRLNERHPGFQAFKEAYPDLTLVRDETEYLNSFQRLGALITGTFTSDVFNMSSGLDDCQQIFSKGYCTALDQSEMLRSLISRMHPMIVRQVTWDNQLLALPSSLVFSYYAINRNAWAEAGLSTEDIPQSFPQLLDFLSRWCDRAEAEMDPGIRVISSWDYELYSPFSYIERLTGLLIHNHMMQLEYAGEPVRFHTPEMLELLAQIRDIGQRLYDNEPPPQDVESGGGKELFASISPGDFGENWPQHAEDMFYLPIKESQPRLIEAKLDMFAVNGRTKVPDLAIQLLESLSTAMPEHETVFLFQDAEPVLNPNNDRSRSITQENIAKTEEKLKDGNLSSHERQDLEAALAKYQAILSSLDTDEERYLMSSSQLADYKTMADKLWFPKPGFFNEGEDHFRLRQLIDRFAAGQLDGPGFLQELDRIVITMEQERM